MRREMCDIQWRCAQQIICIHIHVCIRIIKSTHMYKYPSNLLGRCRGARDTQWCCPQQIIYITVCVHLYACTHTHIQILCMYMYAYTNICTNMKSAHGYEYPSNLLAARKRSVQYTGVLSTACHVHLSACIYMHLLTHTHSNTVHVYVGIPKHIFEYEIST